MSGQKPKKNKYTVYNSLVSYYLLIMFSFFTLFLTNKYSNSRHDKFYLFLGLTAVLAVSVTVSYLLSRAEAKRTGSRLEPFFKPLSIVDVGFLSFLGCAVISALLSPHMSDTVMAEVGRNNGLVLLLAYSLVFFIVSRLYVYKDYVIAVYLIFSCAVALLTLINFFYLDPLELFKNYSERVIKDFGSTIGNKNTIAAYMSMFLPVSVMTFVINKKRYMRVISGISIVFAYIGALSSNSSSVILGLTIAVPVMAMFSARSCGHLRRFMLAMTVMFASGKVLRLFSLFFGDESKGFEFIQNFLIYSTPAYIPIVFFAALYLMMLFIGKKAEPKYRPKPIIILIGALTAAGVIGVIAAMVYFTAVDTTTKLGSFDRLLRFDDRWGTHRGFMWIRSMEEYGKFDILKKLFGYGPDTAYYVLQPHFSELSARFGDGSTDCAHNEYINYLITQGALGLLSYLTVFFGAVIRSVKRAKHDPLALIFISAAVCYAVQATVNLYTPITTPLFIIFISIAEAFNRRAKAVKAE